MLCVVCVVCRVCCVCCVYVVVVAGGVFAVWLVGGVVNWFTCVVRVVCYVVRWA